MSTENNKKLALRWFEEVWNKQQNETIDELFAPDGIAHGLEHSVLPAQLGPEPFRAFWKRFCGAFPDLFITVEDIVAEGDKTAVRFSFRGTHRGNQLGAPATGRPITATAMSFVRWRDGQILEAWNEFDALGVFLEVGVVKSYGVDLTKPEQSST